LGFSFGWDFMGETIEEAKPSCQQVLLPTGPVFTEYSADRSGPR
jgi:hypothetical protein